MPSTDIFHLSTPALWLEALPVAQVLWPDLIADDYLKRLADMTAKGYALYGIRSEGALAGIAGVQEISLLARGKVLWLFDMAVLPGHRGGGLGVRLLEHLKELARNGGYSRLLLHTSADREATCGFYRSQLGEPFGVVFRAVTGEPLA